MTKSQGHPHLAASLKAAQFVAPTATADTVVLTERQRIALSKIALRLRLPARKVIYREDGEAQSIYSVIEGFVKTYRDMPSGRRVIGSFLFPRDLFGLAHKGRYVNTAQAISAVTLYRFPLTDLVALLKQDGEMQFQFMLKVTHELREAQRRAILLGRRDAPGRLAMFVALMAEQPENVNRETHSVSLPMTRSDIAAFLGLSLESVSRASAELERRELIEFEGRHVAKILDQARLAKLVAEV
jgi:CRP-like cAMP-binding protein